MVLGSEARFPEGGYNRPMSGLTLGGSYLIKLEHAARFPDEIKPQLRRLADISKWLRKEREFAFYGDVDFIPTDEYSKEDAERAR